MVEIDDTRCHWDSPTPKLSFSQRRRLRKLAEQAEKEKNTHELKGCYFEDPSSCLIPLEMDQEENMQAP